MRIIHGSGYSERDRRDLFGPLCCRNVVKAAQDLARGMERLGEKYHDASAEKDAKELLTMDYMSVSLMQVLYNHVQVISAKNVVGALTQLSLGISKKFIVLSLPMIFLYRSSYPDPKSLAQNCAKWRKRGAF